MKMEKNKTTLDRAIAALPQYQPPDFLWDDLADQLDFEENLEKPLSEMPVYAPPANLWETLATQIEQTPELSGKPKKNRSFRWPAVGISLLLGTLIWLLMIQNQPEVPLEKQSMPPAAPLPPKVEQPMAQALPPATQPTHSLEKKRENKTVEPGTKTDLQHRAEVVDDMLMMVCRQTEDPNFSIVETLCREALPVCEEPRFKQLKTELDELNHAHTELKNALGNFADDPEMVSQLIDIEKARNQILQELVAMI